MYFVEAATLLAILKYTQLGNFFLFYIIYPEEMERHAYIIFGTPISIVLYLFRATTVKF